ncbi:unnamed protein product [Lampetra fluviatilis]
MCHIRGDEIESPPPPLTPPRVVPASLPGYSGRLISLFSGFNSRSATTTTTQFRPSKNFIPPVSRDRIISKMPKCYTEDACITSNPQFHAKVKTACQEHRTGTVGLKISKVVVVGDLAVGKTCLINRFCKDTFDRDYKATIGVDFEVERFEICGVPFSLQIWDTAGQERFKCIAAAYYRGAQVVLVVFDLADIESLDHAKQWLKDAMKENDPDSVLVFLVGTKKDLLSEGQCSRVESDAIKIAKEMKAEYWSVSAKTGDGIKDFFFRIAAQAFEDCLLKELERPQAPSAKIGGGDFVKVDRSNANVYDEANQKKCC